jgi:inhibitor of KinA sporulation pathway (predicted exonuclease)
MTLKQSHHRYFVTLDLEMNQPSGRIIEVGAVVGDALTGEIVDRLKFMVNPRESITPFITNLTGITDADVAGAGTVYDAYEALKAMSLKWGASRTLLTWGGGDSIELRNQIAEECPGVFDAPKVDAVDSKKGGGHGDDKENGDDDHVGGGNPNFFFFGHRWEDMKTVYKMWGMANDVVGKAGLEKALTRLGLTFDGTPHRALDDAANTWKVYMFFKELMVDKLARPGVGRRPLNALEAKEQKRREKIVAAAIALTPEDLAEVTAAIGERPEPVAGDVKSFNRTLAWSEQVIAYLRERNRKRQSQRPRPEKKEETDE